MRSDKRSRLGLALAAAPLLLPFLVVAGLGVNNLRLDEFFYVDFLRALREGGDWLPYLWEQHNEHRVIPTKLVMIPNALFFSWNRVNEMFVSALLAVLIALGLWQLYRRSGGSDLLLFAPLAWLACSVAQYEILLYGLLNCHYFTILGMVWALVFLDRPGAGSFAAAVFFGFLASFSIFNGLMVWPAGLFLLLARGRPALAARTAVWAAAGVAAGALYRLGFEFGIPLRPSPDLSVVGLAKAGFYGLVTLGAPLAGGSVAWGFTMGAMVASGVAAMALGWRRGGRERLREEALPACLIAYGLLSCAMAALGRSVMSIPALQPRYIAYSSLAVAGVYLLACIRLAPAAGARFAAVLALMVAGLAAANLHGFDRARDWRRDRLREKFLLQTFDRQADPDVAGLAFELSELRRLAPYLRDERLGPFAEPQDVLLLVRWQEGTPLGEILPGRPVEQTLVCPVGDLHDVAIAFATYGRPNTSTVLVTVEAEGRRLGGGTVHTAGLPLHGWTRVPLDEPLRGCRGRVLRIRAESGDATPGNAVTLWTYPVYYEGTLRQGADPVPDRSLGVALNGYRHRLL